jgi:hypothetical protein
MVPLTASFNKGPNVFPLSVLILITGTLLVAFALSHQVTTTPLSPDVSISALIESTPVVLLRLILFPKCLFFVNLKF